MLFVVDDDARMGESVKNLSRVLALRVETFASAQNFLRRKPPDVPGCSLLRVRMRFFFQAEDGIRDLTVTGVQTCALPISELGARARDGPAPEGRGVEPEPGGLELVRERSRALTADVRDQEVLHAGRPELEIGRASCRERV